MVGVSGPTAPKAAQIAAFMGFFVIGTTNQPDLVAAFSIIFLSGLILVGISMLKISRFIHYTPYPVIAGFMCGIGVIVILTQINAFLGLESQKSIHGVFENLCGHCQCQCQRQWHCQWQFRILNGIGNVNGTVIGIGIENGHVFSNNHVCDTCLRFA